MEKCTMFRKVLFCELFTTDVAEERLVLSLALNYRYLPVVLFLKVLGTSHFLFLSESFLLTENRMPCILGFLKE